MIHRTYREQRFRVESGSSFRGMFVCLILVGLSFVAIAHFGWGRPFYWLWDGIVAPILYAVLLAFGVAYLRLRLTVSAMPEGLRTFDVFGRDHVVPWESIDSVRRWSLFGMPSARLTSTQFDKPLWLPLNLDDREQFIDLMQRYTEPNNPLRTLRELQPMTAT